MNEMKRKFGRRALLAGSAGVAVAAKGAAHSGDSFEFSYEPAIADRLDQEPFRIAPPS